MEVRLRDGPLPFKLQDSAEEAPASSSLDGDGLGSWFNLIQPITNSEMPRRVKQGKASRSLGLLLL
jgi:hypothetical protein